MSLDRRMDRAYDFMTMAKSDDSDGGNGGSWPGFLSELTKNFLILRDIFGYALPGAVFLAIGVLCRRFSLHDVQYFLQPYTIPMWLALVLVLAACYTTGHLMSQVAYFFFNRWGWPFPLRWRWPLVKAGGEPKTGHTAAHPVPPRLHFQWRWPFFFAKDEPKTGKHALDPVLIALRESHTALLTELDRQTVMTQLRGSTGAAMLLGFVLFYLIPTPPLGVLAGVAGAFLLLVFMFSAKPHMSDLTQDRYGRQESSGRGQSAGTGASKSRRALSETEVEFNSATSAVASEQFFAPLMQILVAHFEAHRIPAK